MQSRTGVVPSAAPPIALKPGQIVPWRRVMHALDGWGAVVLAEAVGAGKTWIALAAAIARRVPVAVIAPAILRNQWLQTASRVECRISFTSHEQASRGVLPPDHSGIALIDEAHRLRHSNTRRVGYLAPWLPGREVVLITGTPIVTAPRDLVRILRLVLADDALRLDGIASLEALSGHAEPPMALTRLVIRSPVHGTGITVTSRRVVAGPAERARGRGVIAALGGLSLGETTGISRLVRSVLLDAAASSDRAWRAALIRYATLLRHAQEAGVMSRDAIRRFVGRLHDQVVLWELLRVGDSPTNLPVHDLEQVDALLRAPPAEDSWIDDLTTAICDTIPTLWFTRHVATVKLLCERLGCAWVTGKAAGIGHVRFSRDTVLAAFGPDRESWCAMRALPRHLVLTAVGAEGLDLQGAGRVIHVDLPWHDVAMRQRLGRIVRSGQLRPVVMEVVRIPAPALSRALGIVDLIRSRRDLSSCWLDSLASPNALVTIAGEPVEAERGEIARQAGSPNCIGIDSDKAILIHCRQGTRSGLLAFESSALQWRQVSPDSIAAFAGAIPREALGSPRSLPGELVALIMQVTAAASVSRPRLVLRLSALARSAVRNRRSELISELDVLLRVVTRSHPIGIERQLDLCERSDTVAWDGMRALGQTDRPVTIVGWAWVDQRVAEQSRRVGDLSDGINTDRMR